MIHLVFELTIPMFELQKKLHSPDWVKIVLPKIA